MHFWRWKNKQKWAEEIFRLREELEKAQAEVKRAREDVWSAENLVLQQIQNRDNEQRALRAQVREQSEADRYLAAMRTVRRIELEGCREK